MRLRQILSLCFLFVLSCTFLFCLISGKSSIILGTLTTDYLGGGTTTTTAPYVPSGGTTDTTYTTTPTTTTSGTTVPSTTTTGTTAPSTTTTAPSGTTSTIPTTTTTTSTTAYPTTTAPTTTSGTTTGTIEYPTTTATTSTTAPSTTTSGTTTANTDTTATTTNPVNVISVPISETSPAVSTTDTANTVHPTTTDTTAATAPATTTETAPAVSTTAATNTTTAAQTAATSTTTGTTETAVPTKITAEMLNLNSQIKNPVTTTTRYCLEFPFKPDSLIFKMEGPIVKTLPVSQVSESPIKYCAMLKIEDFQNGSYKLIEDATYKGIPAQNIVSITVDKSQSQEATDERNSELENKCSQTGADSSEECKDYYVAKYSDAIDCTNLDSAQCGSTIKETYIAAIVEAKKKYESLDEQSASILTRSMTAGKLENLVNNTTSGEKLDLTVPLKEKETEIKIIKSYEKIVIDKDKGLIQTAPIVVSIDTDGDGIPDDVEKRIGTKPNVADTDGDGYKDGEEVQNGYDPLGEGKKDLGLSPIEKVLINNEPIEHAKTSGEQTDSLSIAEVKTTYNEKGKQSGYDMNGKAFPDSVLTLYIYSDVPIVTTVTTDEFGNWEYHFEKPLEDGNHEIYISINDDTGKVVKKSSPLGFLVQEAQAATDVTSPTSQESDKMINYYLYAAGILIVIGALVFVTALVRSHRKNKGDNAKDNNTNVKA